MTGEEIEALTALSRSRTEPAGRVSRAADAARPIGRSHRSLPWDKDLACIIRRSSAASSGRMAYGALAALDDRPRPGKEPTITPEAKAWLVSLACDKAKEHGYPHELWTTRLLARHARERGPAAGHQCLARLVQGTVCKLLGQEEIKPHKVRYYLERRDAEFEQKMAEVLCVYREVQVLKKAAAKAEKVERSRSRSSPTTRSRESRPSPRRRRICRQCQAVHATFARDHEYKRHGTLSLLAGIDLLTGKVHALVRERHRSREFIEFLKLLDAAYPASTAIKLILDNHSAHISRETRAWLDTRPPGRFDFTFTPKHGSWLNLIEGFFSKFARSVLRHIRVTSKQELKERIMAGIDDVTPSWSIRSRYSWAACSTSSTVPPRSRSQPKGRRCRPRPTRSRRSAGCAARSWPRGWSPSECFIEAVGVQALRAAEGGGQRLQGDPDDVVLWLLGGQGRATGLSVNGQHLGTLLLGSEALRHDVGPHAAGGTVLGHFLEQVVVGVPEERQAGGEGIDVHARRRCRLDVGDAVGQREGDLLDRRRSAAQCGTRRWRWCSSWAGWPRNRRTCRRSSAWRGGVGRCRYPWRCTP